MFLKDTITVLTAIVFAFVFVAIISSTWFHILSLMILWILYFLWSSQPRNSQTICCDLPNSSGQTNPLPLESIPRIPWHYRSDHPRHTWPNKIRLANLVWSSEIIVPPINVFKKYSLLLFLMSANTKIALAANIWVVLNTYHITFFWISYHSFQLVSDTFLGESSSKLFRCPRLWSIEYDQTSSGGFQFFDKGIIWHCRSANLCRSAKINPMY